jgi:hypothetical protein
MSFLLNPFVFAGAAGDFESIATVTVGAGGASSIDFTSIPGTYQHLQIRWTARSARAATEDFTIIRVNGDSGSNYAEHRLVGDGSSATAVSGTSLTYVALDICPAASATSSVFSGGVCDILDYVSTSKNTTFRSFGSHDRNGAGQVRLYSGLWMNTNAITSIKLLTFFGSNFTQHTTAALYGIKA